jgi:hypothetical protein
MGIPEGFHFRAPWMGWRGRCGAKTHRPPTALTLFNPSDYLIFLSFTFPRIFLVQ